MSSSIKLFYISNYISFCNYVQIINKENIDIDDCLFYSPRLSLNQIDSDLKINLTERLSYITNDYKFFGIKIIELIIRRKKLKSILKNKNFVFYTPHLINHREKIIISLKNCKGYYFVEEGLPAYLSEEEILQTCNINPSTIKNKINSLLQISGIGPFSNFKNKLKGSYGNNKKSFKDLQTTKNKFIPLKFPSNNKDSKYSFEKHVLITDSLLSFTKFKNYLISLDYLIEYFKKKKIKIISIKFHPDYSNNKEHKNQIINKFKLNKIKLMLIPDEIFVDKHSNYNNNINYYLLSSSLFIYLNHSKSRLHIFDKMLGNVDEQYNCDKKLVTNISKKLEIELIRI